MSTHKTRRGDRREAALTLRDNAIAIVAHDLRSPLGTIMIAADLLMEVDDVPRRRHFLDIIMRSARQADFLIHDLLDVTRIENGALQVTCSSEPAGYLIESICELFAAEAAAGGLLLGCDTSQLGDAHVMVDNRRFVQLLSNLLSNAIKFTQQGGSIRVSATLQDDFVKVDVTDNGSGIEPDELPHVFERFWQANHHHRAGAGLGLAIARGIAEAHGGRIGVNSIQNEGSTFFFTVPRSAPPTQR